jgi:hypothetical protein
MIDLTKEFNKFIGKDHDIMLIRHNTTTHCHCWRKETATPDPNCPNCLGGGFVFQEWIKKGKTFKFDNDVMKFYCSIDSDTYYIRKGDLLFEIWVDEHGGFLKEPKLGDNILKRNRWIVERVTPPQSMDHIPHFMKIEAIKQPSTR